MSTKMDYSRLPRAASSTVSVGVGVCAHNEERNISKLLGVLTSISLFETITIVSSGSTDATDQIVRERCLVDPRVQLIVEKDRGGKTSAINTLIERCHCDILVFVSADTIPTASGVLSLLRQFDDPNVAAASGRPIPVNPKKGFGITTHIMWAAHWNFLWNLSKRGKLAHISGEMCAITSRVMRNIPRDIINEDAYIALTAALMGFRSVFDPNAIVYMKAPSNVIELFEQRRRVIAGHKQVFVRTGLMPTVLPISWFKHPTAFVKTSASILRQFRFKTFFWASILLTCEFAAFMATTRFARGLVYPWKPIPSTKTVQ